MTQLVPRQDLLTHMAQEEDGAPRAYQVLEGSSCGGQGQLSGKYFIPTSAVDNSSESVFLFLALIVSRSFMKGLEKHAQLLVLDRNS